jgi:drug/metabolite transporter (DMT)-like permease
VRRISAAELMLLATVSIWALGFTVARYAVTNGFEPLAYSALRFASAAFVVSGIAYGLERSLTFRRRHGLLLAGAAFVGIYLNQIGFIYAIDLTNEPPDPLSDEDSRAAVAALASEAAREVDT